MELSSNEKPSGGKRSANKWTKLGVLAVCLVALTFWLRRAHGPARDPWREYIPLGTTEREGVLDELRDEYASFPKDGWSIMDGCPRVPSFPCAMSSAGKLLFVATEGRLESFDLDAQSWKQEPLQLPTPTGPGVCLTSDPSGTLFMLPGGGSDEVWKLEPGSERMTRLPSLGMPIGRGAALADWNGALYLARGMKDDQFWRLPPGGTQWLPMGRIGGESTLDMGFGRNSGFFTVFDDLLLAWPNHHIHRFDLINEDWRHGPEVGQKLHHGNWVAMNFVPTTDGGGVASAQGVDSIYAIGGFFSRSLNRIIPGKKQAYFLRPRLPYPMIGEGDRLTIANLDNEPVLIAYAVEPENKLCLIPLDALEQVDKRSDRADVGSPWHRFHTNGGGNGVRHWSTRAWVRRPTPLNMSTRPGGTLGVMGAMGDELFSMRRAFTRQLDVARGVISYYPGYNLGSFLGQGACGAFDGDQYIYFLPGGSHNFVRRQVPSAPITKTVPDVLLPIMETDMERLPGTPRVIGRGGSLACWDGSVYALRGGGTNEFWRYEPKSKTWSSLPSLPSKEHLVGRTGAGLVSTTSGIYAVLGDAVWKFEGSHAGWERFGSLGMQVHWDGGMVAVDGDRHIYVARGGYSTRIGRLDLATGDYEELAQRLPDAVSAEGNRMGIITVDGERRLYLHRGHNSNEILWIALADFSHE